MNSTWIGGAMNRPWDGGEGSLQIVATVFMVTALMMVSLFFSRKNSPRLPPGPRGWPVVGSLLSMEKRVHRSLTKLSDKYGPIVYLHLGFVPVLVVSSPEMAKEVLKTHDKIMASRPGLEVFSYVTYKGKDIVFAPLGEHWRTLRKICALELFSPTRIKQFQVTRQREIISAIHAILERSKRGQSSDIHDFIATVSANDLTMMMMNKRYCVADGSPRSAAGKEIKKLVHEVLSVLGAFHISDYIPILRPFDLDGDMKRAVDIRERFSKFMEVVIDEHRTKTSSGETDEDFIDLLLRLSVDGKTVSDETIKAIFMDLVAGNDAPNTAIEWTLANLMKHPHVMRKLQDELDNVVGPNRLVEESDIPDLPYLQAVVKEALRLHPPTPLLLPHESTEDCNIAGYRIPAKTQVFVNAFAIQRDPALWKNPLEFNPDRFLNSTTDVKGSHYNLIPFGSGRRSCPGMNLALLRIQHASAQLVHTVTWSLPGGQKGEDLDMMETTGLAAPKEISLQVMAEPRLSIPVLYSITENLNAES